MKECEETLQSSNLLDELPRLKIKSNGLKRTITGLSLIGYFAVVIYCGLFVILLHALAIQVICYNEIINIAYRVKKVKGIPYFRRLNWYFVIVANYFFIGETFTEHLEVYIRKYYVIQVLTSYHRFLSFCFYFAGIIWFLTRVRRKIIRQQFSLLAWTHFLLIIICMQSYMVVQIIFQGLIWLLINLWLIILNDVFAYVFGRMYGKTPLISVSPKKTIEGFIGGGISTFVLGSVLAYIHCHVQYFVCPITLVEADNGVAVSTNCTPSYLFQPTNYYLGDTGISISLFPFMFHALALCAFASCVAPFGGFFASGFKRACNIKDFSDLIPGHGGLMDRFDCQFLMVTFVNVYISTFIETPKVDTIFRKILDLSEYNQLKFYHMLYESLHNRGLTSNLDISM
nr:gustatory receptor [Semanotus bifasciatus]